MSTFGDIYEHEFWVIGISHYPEKITSIKGIQIYLDPLDARTNCNIKNEEFQTKTGIMKSPYKVYNCKADFKELRF